MNLCDDHTAYGLFRHGGRIFVLLGITPSDFTEGVFRQITSKPKNIRDEINESTQRKKNSSYAVRSRKLKTFFA